MSNTFDTMSDIELRQYFLQHRDDESFHAYMDRRAARPQKVILTPEELEGLTFDEKMKFIDKRMREHFGDKLK